VPFSTIFPLWHAKSEEMNRRKSEQTHEQ